MGRTSWQMAAAATLVVLLAVLGTLQYRWLGDVSDAERERLRSSLRARAAELVDDFNREITRLYLAFHVDANAFERAGASSLIDAYNTAQSSSPVGGLVRQVFLLEAQGPQANVLQALDPVRGTLAPVEWPSELAAWRDRAARIGPLAPGMPPPFFMADAVDAATPALVIPMPALKRIENGRDFAVLPDPTGVLRTLVVWLDVSRLRELVALLAERHFGAPGASEYLVKITSREDPSRLVYATAPNADLTAATADLSTSLFDLQFDEFNRFNLHVPPGTAQKNRFAIAIVRRAGGPRPLMAAGDRQGEWQMLVRGKSGSLDSLVARSRRRNMAIGLGVLGLLAVSFVFVIGSAQRQQRLARLQMEFVAAVSHELRTPLAVIQSAGENLADGVVADGDQVRRYGSLIRTEGRRLGDMVERLMEFAGISSGAAPRPTAEVDVRRVVDDAVNAVVADAGDRGVAVAVRTDAAVPPVVGDSEALRSAIQNVIGNAVKYSASGGTVDVGVDADGDRVRIMIVDRGLGIDAADLPHIFKPFFRGRRAADAQIRGTGVGLSVVRHVVDAHQGEISVDSRPGEGTTVVVRLPAAPRREPALRSAEASRSAERATT